MKISQIRHFLLASTLIAGSVISLSALSAISLDRTRVVFDGSQKSVSINIANKNKQLPYLAQGWIENSEGKKITSPFVVLPPIQRIEPDKASQVRIEALPEVKNLPQDRESIFYFNLREIPPKSDKPNVLQLALQSKIKMFYRPAAIVEQGNDTIPAQKLVMIKQGDSVMLKNPTPFYITITNGASSKSALNKVNMNAAMIAPFAETKLDIKASALGSKPVLTYINDYGGRPDLTFQCQGNTCSVVPELK
ncbi:P pilus assembly chaperone PapD [Orbus hercynius]|uniref:P pilus assembly chaperone PapD n=1 Tax=Orbus hercynius TaxID=593135 RepID=A0A495RCN1_9GAMM|nr:fimbria/pilus periplasmic chaperone [Orbus hercynius]RKS85119.1 P pilus assembly chaperone PapD [Orbus hercynius]